MGEFLYELCNAVLYKYGGYDKKYFKVGMWGDYIRVLVIPSNLFPQDYHLEMYR